MMILALRLQRPHVEVQIINSVIKIRWIWLCLEIDQVEQAENIRKSNPTGNNPRQPKNTRLQQLSVTFSRVWWNALILKLRRLKIWSWDESWLRPYPGRYERYELDRTRDFSDTQAAMLKRRTLKLDDVKVCWELDIERLIQAFP